MAKQLVFPKSKDPEEVIFKFHFNKAIDIGERTVLISVFDITLTKDHFSIMARFPSPKGGYVRGDHFVILLIIHSSCHSLLNYVSL